MIEKSNSTSLALATIAILGEPPRRLPENRLICSGRTCQAGSSDLFHQIERLSASNDRKIQFSQLRPRYDRYSRTFSLCQHGQRPIVVQVPLRCGKSALASCHSNVSLNEVAAQCMQAIHSTGNDVADAYFSALVMEWDYN